MKSLLFSLLLCICIVKAEAQYKPYVSAGSALSSGQLSYSAEVGIYKEKIWYAIGASTWDNQWATFFKTYRRVAVFGSVSTFATGAISINITPEKELSFSPGLATVFNLGEKFAPQLSLEFPIYENTPVWKPLPMVFGLSLNYWIK